MGQNRSARRKVEKLQAEKRKRVEKMLTPKPGQPLWGLWDIKDGLWLGDDNGPRKFNDEMLAKIAARTYAYQLGWAGTRVQAKLFDSSGKKRDELPVKVSALRAYQMIESGRVI